jgi:hypothetical protein
MKTGVLTAQFTYAEFKDACSKVSKTVDFSRLAKYHMEQKREAAAAAAATATAAAAAAADAASSKSRGAPDAKRKHQAPPPPPGAAPKQTAASRLTKKQKTANDDCDSDDDSTSDNYDGCTKKELETMCIQVGLPKTGPRETLMERLRGPHPPQVWLQRKQKGEFVPERYNVAGTALLVALYLHERKNVRPGGEGAVALGMTKDELYPAAEELNITKNPFSGGTTQTGPYHYDGWSSMGKLLKGDPELVIFQKGRYRLTRSCDIAGYPVAEAMHRWCHAHNHCSCGQEL